MTCTACLFLTTALAASAVAPENKALMLPTARWDRECAAHLLRRAAFGGTPEEIDRLAAEGLQASVDRLIDYHRIPQTDPGFAPVRGMSRDVIQRELRDLDNSQRIDLRRSIRRLDHTQLQELRRWWMRRMIRSPRPFEERMTLFWHGVFTSGHREVRDSTMLFDQNELLRKMALANFRDILVAVSQNPAMLRYLDNATNRKNAPNENYARELLELFTLGVGAYTEHDVKEAARALTGWTIRDGHFKSVEQLHDGGSKSFLGHTGALDGDDLIDIILEQPAASRHLARKLLEYFVSPDPQPAEIESLAAVVRARNFDIGEIMRTLLKSELFYDPQYRFAIVKSPVELVVGTVHLLEVEPSDLAGLVAATREQGQELFQPPNVKGWDGGIKWIDTATLFARYNFASAILAGSGGGRLAKGRSRGRRFDDAREEARRALAGVADLVIPDSQIRSKPQSAFDPSALIDRYRLYTADRVLNHFLDRLLQQRINHLHRDELRALLLGGAERIDPRTSAGRTRVIALINAMLCTPEFQLK